MRISDWSSDVCSSDLAVARLAHGDELAAVAAGLGQRAARPAHPLVHRGIERDALQVLRQLVAADRLPIPLAVQRDRSEEHTSELQSLMRISYAVFCLKKTNNLKDYKTSITSTHNTDQQSTIT